MKILRIAVVGAECTGKSHLCQQLAQDLPGITFEEPLRRWVREHGKPPAANEQIHLIQWQQHAEAQAIGQAMDQGLNVVLCDSTPLVTAVYSELYYQDRSLYAWAQQHHKQYDLTLWCQPDIPWQPDPGMRDGETYRLQTHNLLHAWLQNSHGEEKLNHEPSVSWGYVAKVRGLGLARVQQAKHVIDQFMLQPWA